MKHRPQTPLSHPHILQRDYCPGIDVGDSHTHFHADSMRTLRPRCLYEDRSLRFLAPA